VGGKGGITVTVTHSHPVNPFPCRLKTTPSMQLSNPSLATSAGPLYFPKPAALRDSLRPNLAKPLPDLGIEDGDELTVTDDVLSGGQALALTIRYEAAA
jgi:hypothetical protein